MFIQIYIFLNTTKEVKATDSFSSLIESNYKLLYL